MFFLTFSAHVRHHRHQNKQEGEIISDRLHRVWSLLKLFRVKRPWDQHFFFSSETPTKHRLSAPRRHLLPTSARVRCLNGLTNRAQWLSLFFPTLGPPLRLKTVVSPVTEGWRLRSCCRSVPPPLRALVLGASSSGQRRRRAFSTTDSS